jgi:peptidylprolyl isomerase
VLQLQLDGFHAPLTAGNFLVLVKEGFYDQMPFQKVQELFVQTGTPSDRVIN